MMEVVGIEIANVVPSPVPAFLSKLWKMVDNPDTGMGHTAMCVLANYIVFQIL